MQDPGNRAYLTHLLAHFPPDDRILFKPQIPHADCYVTVYECDILAVLAVAQVQNPGCVERATAFLQADHAAQCAATGIPVHAKYLEIALCDYLSLLCLRG